MYIPRARAKKIRRKKAKRIADWMRKNSGPARTVYASHKGMPAEASVEFLLSYEWRKVRMEALKRYGARCQCCGATAKDAMIHVDHIKPRLLYPELALSIENLQILCEVCNHGKGNWDMTDWRKTTA